MSDMVFEPNARGELDLATLFKIIWLRRWLVIICTLATAAAFVAAAFILTPVYRAETVVVPGDADNRTGGLGSMLGQFGGLAAMAGLDLSSKGSMTEEALAVLRSRGFTEGFLRDEAILPQLFAKKW